MNENKLYDKSSNARWNFRLRIIIDRVNAKPIDDITARNAPACIDPSAPKAALLGFLSGDDSEIAAATQVINE